jgi:hypothetical protein
VATILSQQFVARGLQFFKVNKTFTHVSVARPHFLDLEATPVSAQVKSIVEFINATPKCTRRALLEKLAPTPKSTAPAAPAAPPAEGAAPVVPAPPEPTPEQAAIIGDLHWLIHQGHVIEFANGILETAKKPVVKPPKPPKPEAPATAETPAAEVSAGEVSTPEPATAEAAPAPENSAPTTQPAAAAEPASDAPPSEPAAS